MGKTQLRLAAAIAMAIATVLASSGAAQASIFWVLTDSSASDPATAGSVSSATTSGTSIHNNRATVTDTSPIAVDRSHLYYASSDTTIGRADLDGAHADNNFVTGLTAKVRGLAVNDSYLYWTQYANSTDETNRGVFRIGLVGGVAGPALIANTWGAPAGIALDSTYIYWANPSFNGGTPIDGRTAVSRSRLDGTEVIDSYVGYSTAGAPGSEEMNSVAVSGNRLFVSYFGANITVSTMDGPAPLSSSVFLTTPTQVLSNVGMAADSTYLYYSNEPPIGAISRVRVNGSAPPELNFIPSGNGSTIRPFGGVAVEPAPPSPPPASAQTAANNCVSVPKKVRTNRTYRLMRAKCTTNLGKTIEVKGAYRGSLKGDMAYFRIYRNSKGETMLKTYGTRIKLRLTWSSAASGGVPGYRLVKNYRT